MSAAAQTRSQLQERHAVALSLEAAVLGAALRARDPHALLERCRDLHPEDLAHLPHRVLWRALLDLHEQRTPVNVESLEFALAKSGSLDAVGGVAFIGEVALAGGEAETAVGYVHEIRVAAHNRRALQVLAATHQSAREWPHQASELISEARGELERLEMSAPGRRSYLSVHDVAMQIEEFSTRPWVPFVVGGETIDELPLGESLFLMGATGAGKTTLALAMAAHHAQHTGPVIIFSLELMAATIGARLGAMITHESWSDTLRGPATKAACAALVQLPRLCFLDRKRANFDSLRRTVVEVRGQFPDEPIMALVDYAQLLKSSQRSGSDLRMRVADAIGELREIIQDEHLLGLVLSQMSRDNARAARKGERKGLETADGGAESAAIEQAAAITLSLGRAGELQADGSRSVELNVGKARYGGGDRVIELKQWGASGLTRVVRDEPASKVREREEHEREERAEAATKESLSRDEELAMAAMDVSAGPVTRNQLCTMAALRKTSGLRAIASLIRTGALVDLGVRGPGGTTLICTRDQAPVFRAELQRQAAEHARNASARTKKSQGEA